MRHRGMELGGSLATLMRSQIGFATDKDGKHSGVFQINGPCPPKLIRYGDRKTRDGGGRVSSVERTPSADGRLRPNEETVHVGTGRNLSGRTCRDYGIDADDPSSAQE